MNVKNFSLRMSPLLDGGGGDAGAGSPDVADSVDSGAGGDSGEPIEGGSGDLAGQVGEVDFPDGLEDEVRNDPSLAVFVKDGKFNYANMMKSYVHAQKQMGKDKTLIPTNESTEEEWGQFFDKMGRPPLSDYELKPNLGEGAQLDEGMFNGFKEVAHAAGLLPNQAQGILDWFNAQTADAQKNIDTKYQEDYEKGLNALKAEWGDAYEREISLANRALKEFASDEEIEYLKATGLSDDLKLVRLFNKIGKGLSEDTFDQESHGSFGMTKQEAESKINDHFSNPDGPYLNQNHPNHKNAVKEMYKLQEIANAG